MRPAGKVSEKATPDCARVFAAGLVMVKVKVVLVFSGSVPTPNALLIDGGATTDRVAALLVKPVPPSDEVMLPVRLI